MIAVAEKYSIDISMLAPITSERQHAEYLSILDKLGLRQKDLASIVGTESVVSSARNATSTKRTSKNSASDFVFLPPCFSKARVFAMTAAPYLIGL
jgi:hypothetical protein